MLDFLAIDLIEHDYDLKRTLRLIATSRIYQSRAVPALSEVPRGVRVVFRGVQAKRMTAEQFVDAVWQLTGAGPTQMHASIQTDGETDGQSTVRASLVNADALMRSLGRPNREQVVTSRPAELSTLQALTLSNGEILTNWLQLGAEKWLAAKEQNKWTNTQMISRMFLESLSREPTESEIQLLRPDEQAEMPQAVEDLLWIVVMLPEFQLVQ